MILYLSKIKFDSFLERWVPLGSPELAHYKEFLDEFGGDCILLPFLVRLVTVKRRRGRRA